MCAPITATFEVKFPNSQQIFTKQLNKVQGKVTLQFSQDINVHSVDIGMKGDIRSRETIADYSGKLKEINSYIGVLFNESDRVYNGSTSTEPFNLMATKEYSFEFQFPSYAMDLPSSCDSLSSEKTQTKDNITIRYELYVRVLQSDYPEGDTKYNDFLVPLNYQGDTVSRTRVLETVRFGNRSSCKKVKAFGKPKLFIPDYKTGEMINVEEAKKSTRLIKKLAGRNDRNFSSVLKNKALKGDVKLEFIFGLDRKLNLFSKISDIPIFVYSESQLDPSEFSYKGSSTKLGYFHVSSIDVLLEESFKVHKAAGAIKTVLYQGMCDTSFDIKDFRYDQKTGIYKWNTTLGQFIGRDETIFELLKKPLLSNMNFGDSSKICFISDTKLIVKFFLTLGGKFKLNEKHTEFSNTESITKVECYSSFSMPKHSHEARPFHYTKLFSKTGLNANTGGGLNTKKYNHIDGDRSFNGAVETFDVYDTLSRPVNDSSMLENNALPEYDETPIYHEKDCYDITDGFSDSIFVDANLATENSSKGFKATIGSAKGWLSGGPSASTGGPGLLSYDLGVAPPG